MDTRGAERPGTTTRRAARDRTTLAGIVNEVEQLLATSSELTALRFLNERTRFRFTGVYRAEPPMLRNVWLFDRENPRVNVSGAVARLDETYCAITCGTGVPFATRDASNDDRLRAHAARESVLSYGGVPIRAEGGQPWGTLCHFDVRPRLLPATELALLEAVAPLFARRVSEGEGRH